MRLRTAFLLVMWSAVVSVAACRQPDGPVPREEGEVANRLQDISRDLSNVAAGQTDQELADDLAVFAERTPQAEAAARELSRRVARALREKPLTPEGASQLARQLWLAISARELSARQLNVLQEDVRETLMGIGVAEQDAQPVVDQVAEVQKLVTVRQRRWYELF